MNSSESSEYLSLDIDDQEDAEAEEHYSVGEDFEDDVFLAREDQANMASASVDEQKTIKKEQKLGRPCRPERPPVCAVQWSISHRCLDCAWKAVRGGRPHHPTKPPVLPVGPASPPLVTLQSLGPTTTTSTTTRDSGYEPSPTSAFSFTFTSDDEDEDDDNDDDGTGSPGTLRVHNDPHSSLWVTPPINIPPGGIGGGKMRYKSRSANASDKRRAAGDPSNGGAKSPLKEPPDEGIDVHAEVEVPKRVGSFPMRKWKSEPELWGSEKLLPRTPVIVRNDGRFARGQSPPTPIHGRNHSLPATTSDGKPLLFAPSPVTPASRCSREGLIDLTEDGSDGGSGGHHRRVLVLALPDLLVDLDSFKRSATSPHSISPSLQSPSGDSTSSKDTDPASPTDKRSKTLPKDARDSLLPEGPISSSSTPSNASSDPCDVVVSSRPTWRRPRALSCDVTLEVEFGQELRKIADNFSRDHFSRQGGVWRTLKNSIGRRLSFGGYSRQEGPVAESPEERGSHSLPTSPYHSGTHERERCFN